MPSYKRPISGRAILSAGLFLTTASAAMTAGTITADAKILGGTHCYFGICHRVKTLPETAKLIGVKTIVKASFYDDYKAMRSGERRITSSSVWLKLLRFCLGRP